MISTGRPLLVLVLLTAAVAASNGPGIARAAGWGEVAKTVGMDLAAPLAASFGVPVAAVSALFQGGLSTEGVVQALLISQTSKEPVGKVGSLLESNGNDMGATAKALEVAPSAYSDDKVAAVLSDATAGGAQPAPAEEGAKKALGGFLKSQ